MIFYDSSQREIKFVKPLVGKMFFESSDKFVTNDLQQMLSLMKFKRSHFHHKKSSQARQSEIISLPVIALMHDGQKVYVISF